MLNHDLYDSFSDVSSASGPPLNQAFTDDASEILVARASPFTPVRFINDAFPSLLDTNRFLDGSFRNSTFRSVIAFIGNTNTIPLFRYLSDKPRFSKYVNSTPSDVSLIFKAIHKKSKWDITMLRSDESLTFSPLPALCADDIKNAFHFFSNMAGSLNEFGEHHFDVRTPSPSPHFFANLLMGNRIGFPHPLQTTPKSVVGPLGQGSFRAHADTQVLATRWDMRQEENGHPANRQFYVIEDGRQIFYSAETDSPDILEAFCTHMQNATQIVYKLKCGLQIIRDITLLPQEKGLPLAVESQVITIKNISTRKRNLRIVCTGMFGSQRPMALREDVLYSNIIMQQGVSRNQDGSVAFLFPDYCPESARQDFRFHSMFMHQAGSLVFPDAFTMDYTEFVGTGTLERPSGIHHLSNRIGRKGPGFFALSLQLKLKPDEEVAINNFTGLSSSKETSLFSFDTFSEQVSNLIRLYSVPGKLQETKEKARSFLSNYSSFVNINSGDALMDSYVNRNLPFQVLYQTFVSRSFCQTQKGYREIGFREIQDLFASMYYFIGMGQQSLVKDLLREWTSMVFEFGYAYHNFFWKGKEPGKWSDDALWLFQAFDRYVQMTGDIDFLKEECVIAGSSPPKKRPIIATLKAIIRYSSEISVGKHGLPLLDNADWNDCLKLDPDHLDGIEKEKSYWKQVVETKKADKPLKNDFSESVMNAFLLMISINIMKGFSISLGDHEYAVYLGEKAASISALIQKHAWKKDFFARILFNNGKPGLAYLGARGDGFSTDSDIDGTFFLNSFSWAVLSRVATDDQIVKMMDIVEKYLKTPFGLRLVTPMDLTRAVANAATDEYFPGDRENGGVFKHASMMAVSALLQIAKEYPIQQVAERATQLAYWMIDLVLPYKTMENPYELCGNPRFCTQYINSETGENIGPMLSGTSTWLTLVLMSVFGLHFTKDAIFFNPLLRPEQQNLEITIRMPEVLYTFTVKKNTGFKRILDHTYKVVFDDSQYGDTKIPIIRDNKHHKIELFFY